MFKLRPHGQAVKTPPFHGGIPGSNPGGVTKSKPLRLLEEARPTGAKYRRTKSEDLRIRSVFGSIAQLGEHLPYKQGVTGSSPVTSTRSN